MFITALSAAIVPHELLMTWVSVCARGSRSTWKWSAPLPRDREPRPQRAKRANNRLVLRAAYLVGKPHPRLLGLDFDTSAPLAASAADPLEQED